MLSRRLCASHNLGYAGQAWCCLQLGSLVTKLEQALNDTKAPLKREHSLHLLAALSSSSGVVVEPFVVPLLPQLLERCSDQV